MNESKTYEEAIKQLEKIVAKLETGEEGLDESMRLFEEGAKLSAFCYKKLENAQQKIVDFSKLATIDAEDADD